MPLKINAKRNHMDTQRAIPNDMCLDKLEGFISKSRLFLKNVSVESKEEVAGWTGGMLFG